MSCQDVSGLIDAHLDQELDVITSSQFEQHLSQCAACREKYDRYQQMHGAVKAHMQYFHAPEDFEQKLRASLRPQKYNAVAPGWFTGWRPWAVAAAMVAILLFTTLLLQTARRGLTSDALAEQVVSSHIRSLQVNHLSDVASTDQHTVKPWFSGKLDFAPVVKDLTPEGFRLIGGRLDYLDDRPVAAVVYQRRQHVINLFLWPSQASDSTPLTLSIRGYNLAHWTHAHMVYWAVSDVNAADLSEFARDVEK